MPLPSLSRQANFHSHLHNMHHTPAAHHVHHRGGAFQSLSDLAFLKLDYWLIPIFLGCRQFCFLSLFSFAGRYFPEFFTNRCLCLAFSMRFV
jgi:hypothetical protein